MTTAKAVSAGRVSGDNNARLWLALLTVGVPLLLYGLWHYLPMDDYLRSAIDWVDSTGYVGIGGYIVLYTICAMLGIPRTPLNVAAGMIFSYPAALAVVLCGATAAYMTTFWIARHVAQDWVKRQVASSPKVKEILDICNEEPFKAVLLIRLNLLIPGVLKGYGFGTTNVPFGKYLLASILGFLPIALTHVYLGWAGGEAVLSDGEMGTLEKWLVGSGVVLSIAMVAGVYWYGRNALNRRYGRSKQS
ncbi:MAG: VTT domain-containing protein [Gammaproteobacteria bacterium]|nr:VTT domain-containing protein [Gammaproteobacteria bacterium]NND60632.1 TVP38/TMEM64 family protein [Gammaproteobacteria bacterium]